MLGVEREQNNPMKTKSNISRARPESHQKKIHLEGSWWHSKAPCLNSPPPSYSKEPVQQNYYPNRHHYAGIQSHEAPTTQWTNLSHQIQSLKNNHHHQMTPVQHRTLCQVSSLPCSAISFYSSCGKELSLFPSPKETSQSLSP